MICWVCHARQLRLISKFNIARYSIRFSIPLLNKNPPPLSCTTPCVQQLALLLHPDKNSNELSNQAFQCTPPPKQKNTSCDVLDVMYSFFFLSHSLTSQWLWMPTLVCTIPLSARSMMKYMKRKRRKSHGALWRTPSSANGQLLESLQPSTVRSLIYSNLTNWFAVISALLARCLIFFFFLSTGLLSTATELWKKGFDVGMLSAVSFFIIWQPHLSLLQIIGTSSRLFFGGGVYKC